MVKNKIKFKKLCPPKVQGSKTKKPNHQTLQKLVLEHLKNSLYVALLLLEFKDDLYNLR
jgi:hypothetical protein